MEVLIRRKHDLKIELDRVRQEIKDEYEKDPYSRFVADYEKEFGIKLAKNVPMSISRSSKSLANRVATIRYLLDNNVTEGKPITLDDLRYKLGIESPDLHQSLCSSMSPVNAGALEMLIDGRKRQEVFVTSPNDKIYVKDANVANLYLTMLDRLKALGQL